MDDPKEIYNQTRAALVEAQEVLEELTDRIKGLHLKTARWDIITLPGVEREPQEFASLIVESIGPEDFVTYEDFVDALRRWKLAQLDALQKYDAVADDDVEPLPEMPSQIAERQQNVRQRYAREQMAKQRRRKSPRGPRRK